MQDGASSHSSRSTLRFLRQNAIRVLPDWPPNSPDVNPVEHCWAWLARRMVGRSFLTEAQLEAALRQEWEARPPTIIPSLFGFMVRRLTAVVVARGAATRY
jgi:transposase